MVDRPIWRVGTRAVVSLAFLGALLLLTACGAFGQQATPTLEPEHFSGELAFEHVRAQMQWVPRHPGTEGWRKTGDYIIAELQRLGWQVEEQHFQVLDHEGRNIIARRGSGPVVIVGAHYDTRRRADRDPDPQRRSEPVPGAVDGASGVAVLLELARVLAAHDLNDEVWLTFFDAEDNGDLDGWPWIAGSSSMARNLDITPEAMVLVDLVGQQDQLLPFEASSTKPLREEIWAVAGRLGYTSFVPREHWRIIDDHTPFLERGIPAVDIIDFDYPQWHTTADTIDQVSPASLEEVGRTLETWLLERSQER